MSCGTSLGCGDSGNKVSAVKPNTSKHYKHNNTGAQTVNRSATYGVPKVKVSFGGKNKT